MKWKPLYILNNLMMTSGDQDWLIAEIKTLKRQDWVLKLLKR
jgi:hypothetical protein